MNKTVMQDFEYRKIQNYIEAIQLIAEKVGTAETDAIEQLSRDLSDYMCRFNPEKDNDV